MGGKGRSSRPSSPMLIACVRRFLRQHDLIRRDNQVLAAASGGSDSTALVHILGELDRSGELRLAGILHFNHQLRSSADRDERFVERLAASLGVPLVVDREDVGARARRERRSVEDAARAARYAFFERARIAAGADLVALGHTRDDQAETVLLRLVRGAGPRGLAGMYPRIGCFVRPMLTCRREELRAWLAARRLAFLDDETNADVTIPRNRVRAELLPLVAARFNPSIVDVLADQADLARDLWAWLNDEAARLAARVVRSMQAPAHEIVRAIDVAGLRSAPVALQRAVLWRAMSEGGGGRSIGFHHIEAARRLMAASGGGRMDAPGQRLERIGGTVVLRSRRIDAAGRRVAAPPNLFRYPLSIPGEVSVPDAGAVVSAERAVPGAIVGNGSDRHVVLVRGDLCGESLAVRNRRPGDRFRPPGLGGRKKLQDYFVDRKIVRTERDAVPIVVDETDRIIWVAGHGIDESFRVTDRSQPVLILKFKAVGGSA
jgi:tRNA(Ile)-lysidine synthase